MTANKKYKKKFAINSKTGKVTVKKGLKKGTYKIKVKAYTTNEVSSLKESKTKTITIKVK